MNNSVSNERANWIDTLRVADKEWVEMLTDMERRAAMYRGTEKRRDERVRYRVTGGLVIQIAHPGGSRVNYLVRPHNISRRGMGFLHGRFLYPGSVCTITLKTVDGEVQWVPAFVKRCQYLRSGVHDVGVEFEDSINLEDFIANLVPTNQKSENSTSLPQLSGKVLHIDDFVHDRELLKYMMNRIGLQPHSVESAVEGLSLLERMKFDLVVCDYWMPGMTGSQIVPSLREANFKGPVIILTADERPELVDELKAAGCSDVIVKPYTLEELAMILAQHLPKNLSQTIGSDVLHSTQWSDVRMRPLILAFLAKLETQINMVTKLSEDKLEREALCKAALEIKGSAAGLGYPSISACAQKVYRSAVESQTVEQLKSDIDELTNLCAAACRAKR